MTTRRSRRVKDEEEAPEPAKDDEEQVDEEQADEEQADEETEADDDGADDTKDETKEADEGQDAEEENEGDEEETVEEKPEKVDQAPPRPRRRPPRRPNKEDDDEDVDDLIDGKGFAAIEHMDPEALKQMEIINTTTPTSELELALVQTLKRKDSQIERLAGEINKLKAFISKRKQTYKRKRKDEGAPTRALSAYNIFVQDRFALLSKENEQALKSSDSDAQLKRVPPASLVATTGNQWKELSADDKILYEERAREDRKRYEEQMAKYQPPDKQANRKRNKTGYNMFFSAHVLRLKQSESGVPSERGSVARLVGNAWKQLASEEKQYYEREADKHNGMNPVLDKDEDEEEDEGKRPGADYAGQYAPHGDLQYPGIPPPIHGQAMHPPSAGHDPRYYHPHPHWGQAPPHGYYDHHAQVAVPQQPPPRGPYPQPVRGHYQHHQYPPQPYHPPPTGGREYRGGQDM